MPINSSSPEKRDIAKKAAPGAAFFRRLSRAALCLSLAAGSISPSFAANVPVDASVISQWRELPSPRHLSKDDGAIYYSFQTAQGSRIHLVVFNLKSGKWRLRPALSESTEPTSQIARRHNACAAVNGAYFNLSDGMSTGYVTIDGKTAANPRDNKALTGNPKLAPFLETIFKRSEIRIYQGGDGRQSVEIQAHEAPASPGMKLVHSLQSGPRLLPVLTARQEAFLRNNPDGGESDSIGAGKPAARTAFGITPDGYAMFLCAASSKQDPESQGLTLEALAGLMESLGCSQAINLDGGASTTMYVKALDDKCGSTLCGKTPETRVKSVLLLEYVP